jgi:hypothetical protein
MALTEHRTPTPTRQATPSRLRMAITFPRANRTPGAFIIMGRFSLLCYGEIIVIYYMPYTIYSLYGSYGFCTKPMVSIGFSPMENHTHEMYGNHRFRAKTIGPI